MIQTSHPIYYLLFLCFIPLGLFFLWFVFWRKKQIQKLGESTLIQSLMPTSSLAKLYSKFVLVLIAIFFLIIGVLDPLIGVKYGKVKRSGVDIIVALDVSKSMLAEDIKPNRINRAKMFVSKLIDQLYNDRFGLICFAGRAYLQMPLSIDYGAGKMFLANANTDLLPSQGTSIADAVDMARKSFMSNEKKHKVLLIITDGEDHEGADEKAIEEAVSAGIIVHTIGVGTASGANIPIGNGQFKKDKDGNIVSTKLNVEMIESLAKKGNGKSFMLSQGNDPVGEIMDEINKMEKKGIDERVYTDQEHQFQYFLLLAILFMVIEFMLSEKKSFVQKIFSSIKL